MFSSSSPKDSRRRSGSQSWRSSENKISVFQSERVYPESDDLHLAADESSFLDVSLSSFAFPERTVIRQEQIEFCIDRFKESIFELVQSNHSPFIHQTSYESEPPGAIQDLLGVGAMYCRKSPANQKIFFAMLNSRADSLVASSKSTSLSTAEWLVGVQAMIIYQIIRLFDGNIQQRSYGQRHMALLELWTMRLQSTVGIWYNDCSVETPYQHWIFVESIRRTITMSIMVQAMYSLLENGYCSTVPLMDGLPISVNGALWDVSEEEWWTIARSGGGDLTTYRDFTNKWSGGTSLYKNTYETILLAACKPNFLPSAPVLP